MLSLGLSILLDPLSGCCLPSLAIALPLRCNGHFLSILGIGRLEDSKNGLDDKLGVQGGDPILLDSLGADLSRVSLYTGVVDLGDELDLGWLEGVVVRKVKVDGESSSDERCSLGSIDMDIPDHYVVLGGSNLNSGDRSSVQVRQLFIDSSSFPCHFISK